VVFSYETFLTKGLTDFRTVLSEKVETVEVLGPHRVKFTFKTGIPTRDLPQDMGGLPILSKAHYQANNRDLEESQPEPFLGSGPYVLDRMEWADAGLARNPDYWGNDLPINRGRGQLRHDPHRILRRLQRRLRRLQGRQLYLPQRGIVDQLGHRLRLSGVTNGHVKKVELPSGAKASGQAFLFNLRREKFQDPRVREAIGLMFNFEWSNNTLFYGLYARIHSIWENSWLEAAGTPSPEEVAILQPLVDEGLLPASILTDEAVMAPTSGERQLDRANLRRANALLDEAGWAVGNDGLRRNAKGEVLRVEFLNDSPALTASSTPSSKTCAPGHRRRADPHGQRPDGKPHAPAEL
jgi:microcin C transport system substrate-binding protein